MKFSDWAGPLQEESAEWAMALLVEDLILFFFVAGISSCPV